LRVDIYYRNGGIGTQSGVPDTSATIGFHQIGEDGSSAKQGYSLPVVPDTDYWYRISLIGGSGNIPNDWVVEFSDVVIGNRWNIEYIYLNLQGRNCGEQGLINSHHDRKFIWSGDEFMGAEAWGDHGACTLANDMPKIDCTAQSDGVMSAAACPDLCLEICPKENSYCDCGSKMCRCNAGFSGLDCSIDLCEAARCGEHGTCAAKYLGASSPLPVTSEQACICDNGWSGPLCTFNPCEQEKTCSGKGKCVASSISTIFCECDLGFSGENCDIDCSDICLGNYPFRCADNRDDVIEYGCNAGGGCSYSKEGDSLPNGFCAFKSVNYPGPTTCQCEVNDCQMSVQCENGQCPQPQPLEDFTPCNSVPFGVCKSGLCSLTINGPNQPNPTSSPIASPTRQPNPSEPSHCGCKECTNEVWDTYAGKYKCGDRIEWVQTSIGGFLTEEQACILIGMEQANVCGMCDPTKCNNNNIILTSSPTPGPTRQPTASPTASPTKNPTAPPTPVPTVSPTPKPTNFPTPAPTALPTPSEPSHCGCKECTNEVWDTYAGEHKCGDRIGWAQTLIGGFLTEEQACILVGKEQANVCGMCDPTECNNNEPLPPSQCGCKECTEDVLATFAGDFTCGARISYLKNSMGYTEQNACIKIGNVEYRDECGMCDPNRCDRASRRYLRTKNAEE